MERKSCLGCAGKPEPNRAVAKLKFTRHSEADLEAILEYTLETWGEKQVGRYLDDLQECLQELADKPGLGRSCASILPGLKRLEHGRHVVFYRPKEYGIRVIRILHQGMLPDLNLLGGEE
jgi:toxin ParE1/3/4